MKTVLKGLTMAALLAVVATPAQAQQRSWGFGVNGAWVNTGRLATRPDVQDRHLKLDNGWSIGADLEKWFGSRRLGFRAEGQFFKQPFVLDREPDPNNPTNPDIDPDEEQEVLDGFTGVRTIFGGADFMLRLLSPTVDRRFAPFLSLGAGLMHIRHDSSNDPREFEPVDVLIYGSSQTEWAITGGVGADFFLSEAVALRLEMKDYRNFESPYPKLSDPDSRHSGGNNFLYRAGLQFNFGGARVQEPGFIAATPAPAPAPVVTPAPAPAPAPTTEQVSMCVVDANGRLQMVSATRNLQNRNVYVTRNGQQVLFSTAYPATDPIYVKGAPWYIAARPLVLDLDADDMGGDVDDELDDAIENMPDNRVEFVNFGSTQPLPMGDVLYIGSIDGTPLYATRSDIGGLLPDLEARLRVTTDLDDVLDDEAFANRFVNEIQTFYTAFEPGSANCVFQPMSSTRVVRRTRG